MSERGSSVGRYEPIPTIPEESPPSPTPPRIPPPQAEPRLDFFDFWPQCLTPQVNFALAQFERFDTLLPRANAWLREHPNVDMVKCETIEKRVWCLEQITQIHTDPKFEVPSNIDVVYYLKGLRIWYSNPAPHRRPRKHAHQIGYRNTMPQCVDASQKYPMYEDLGPMYAKLNDDLIDRPLEGPIVTMETVTIRLDRLRWEGPDMEVDKTHWPMTPKQHLFFFTRIFYLFECPAYEQVGAADFLPDFMNQSSQKSALPKYTGLPFVMKKFNAWLKQVKDIKITNIQSLEAAYPGKSDKVRTNMNFITKADTMPMIRFIRVTYTRPKFGLPPGGLHIPRALTQKTFLPVTTQEVDEGSGSHPAQLENLLVMAAKMKAWFKHVGNKIISVEALFHPLPLVMNRRDFGESTVLPGEWQPLIVETSNKKQSLQPASQVLIVRVYMEGDYEEPSAEVIQQTLSQGEIYKDCCSLL